MAPSFKGTKDGALSDVFCRREVQFSTAIMKEKLSRYAFCNRGHGHIGAESVT